MATPDLLFNLRNLFYLGAYQSAINNSDVPGLDADAAAERDVIVFRSYIALGSYQLVISEIDSSAATSLQAVKLLALYLTGDKEGAISSLKEWLSDSAIGSNPVLRLIAGIIFMHEQDYNEALKHTHTGGTLDLHALNVQIFLKMHRSDYADKQLKIMQQTDEDHTLTQLANAWLDIAVGGSKIREAYLIFQDFAEKYPMTGMVLNGKAVCCMHMGSFEEAETLLLEALNKDAKDPETLANLIVCNLHLGKPSSRYFRSSQQHENNLIGCVLQPSCSSTWIQEASLRFLDATNSIMNLVVGHHTETVSQLKLSHPDHVLVKTTTSAEGNFERALQAVA
ncbi:hypothetical protein ACQJBY_017477 [Aegilops geniculata]